MVFNTSRGICSLISSAFRRLAFAGVGALVLLTVSTLARGAEATWPQEFKADDARIVFYQPQFDSFDQETLKGRSAVAITPKGKSNPIFAAAWIEAKVHVDKDARTVR